MATSAAGTATASPTPFLPPPPGQQSDFENPPSLAYITNIVVGICVAVVTIFFALRAYLRIWVKHSWIAEDWAALTAWGGTVAYCAVMAVTMAHHGGEHAWDITNAQAEDAAYWFNISSVLYGVFIFVAKLAILLLYRRVFSPQRWSVFDCLIIGLGTILFLFYGATTIIKILECMPRARIFDKSVPGTCIDVSKLLNASGLFNTITDFIILLLPVKAVWGLHMKRKKKMIVVLVFTFGLCAPVFSLVGFVVRLQISGSSDTTWNQPEILLWGAAELTTCNMCVCFPEMGALFQWHRRNRPSQTNINGEYTLSRPRVGLAYRKTGPMDDDAYLELNDTPTYGVRVGPTDRRRFPASELGDVHVTEEVMVESRQIGKHENRY